MSAKIRVLVVDDSAFARKVLKEICERDERIEVVGTARDGLDALEKAASLRPDVMTLDLFMPHLDGLGLLAELDPNGPRVVVVSSSAEDSDLVVRALQAGAITAVHKPAALATDRLYEIASDLVGAVLLAAEARRPAAVRPPPAAPAVAPRAAGLDLVVIGTSTGGPVALTQLLSSLPADFPVPIAVVAHIPVGYTQALAERLDEVSPLEVREAYEELELRAGRVVVARAGMHLAIEQVGDKLCSRLRINPIHLLHRPSVDVLFESAAAITGARTLGVVLTGMGDDGLAGSRAIHTAGGRVLTEAESSCVVFGMPRCVVEAGLSSGEASIGEMVPLILARAASAR